MKLATPVVLSKMSFRKDRVLFKLKNAVSIKLVKLVFSTTTKNEKNSTLPWNDILTITQNCNHVTCPLTNNFRDNFQHWIFVFKLFSKQKKGYFLVFSPIQKKSSVLYNCFSIFFCRCILSYYWNLTIFFVL